MSIRRKQGFTLLELMVTIAIAGILLTIGVPSFQSVVTRNRISANTNEFIVAINLARSEAIKRGSEVSVCKSTDGTSCTTSGDWGKGWIVYLPSSPIEVIRIFGALNGDDTLTSTAHVVTFNSSGALAHNAPITFDFSLCQKQANQRNRIVINLTGRPNRSEVPCT